MPGEDELASVEAAIAALEQQRELLEIVATAEVTGRPPRDLTG